MLSIDQDILLRDILLAIAALIGLIYVLIINIKDSRHHFRAFKKIDINKSIYEISSLDWHGEYIKFYSLTFDEQHVIWEINMFTIRMIKKDKSFSSFAGFPWFEFSKSQSATEKIMSPILRKIFIKYRSKFEKVLPIQVVRVPKETVHFYTWLHNETQTHTAIFNFLEEVLIISSEAKSYPNLSIIWDDVIYVEATFPNNPLFKDIENLFEQIMGIDCTVSNSHIILKLWIAFSIEKIPNSLKNKEKKRHTLKAITKVS